MDIKSPNPEQLLLIKSVDAQRILNYLMNRPWGEVYQLIPGITSLKEGEINSGENNEEEKKQA